LLLEAEHQPPHHPRWQCQGFAGAGVRPGSDPTISTRRRRSKMRLALHHLSGRVCCRLTGGDSWVQATSREVTGSKTDRPMARVIGPPISDPDGSWALWEDPGECRRELPSSGGHLADGGELRRACSACRVGKSLSRKVVGPGRIQLAESSGDSVAGPMGPATILVAVATDRPLGIRGGQMLSGNPTIPGPARDAATTEPIGASNHYKVQPVATAVTPRWGAIYYPHPWVCSGGGPVKSLNKVKKVSRQGGVRSAALESIQVGSWRCALYVAQLSVIRLRPCRGGPAANLPQTGSGPSGDVIGRQPGARPEQPTAGNHCQKLDSREDAA